MKLNTKEREMQKLLQISKEISNKGGKVFIVGGYVRDLVLGKLSKDIDVEIHNITVKETEQILNKFGIVDKIGEAFGVLVVKGLDIDFTFPRTENKTGNKHTDFDVVVNPFLSVKEAARRRDFTMGALYFDLETQEIVDPFNGIKDIKNNVIKFVDKETFVEDPLRALRAAQFAARFNMKIDQSAIDLAQTMDYANLSKERIHVELEKVLSSDKPSIGFNALLEMGVIEQLFPEIFEMVGNVQSKIYHPEGDTFVHTMGVVDTAAQLKHLSSNPEMFMLAALVHDIGKPKTTKIDGDKITAYGHENIGANMVPSVIPNINPKKDLIKPIKFLVKRHMLAHNLHTLKDKTFRKIMFEGNIKDLLLLSVADQFSGGEINLEKYMIDAHYPENLNKVNELLNGQQNLKELVQGRDLIQLGIKPGPQIGDILKNLKKKQIDGFTKDQLLNYAKKYISKGN